MNSLRENYILQVNLSTLSERIESCLEYLVINDDKDNNGNNSNNDNNGNNSNNDNNGNNSNNDNNGNTDDNNNGHNNNNDTDKSKNSRLRDDPEFIFHLGIYLLEAAAKNILDKDQLYDRVKSQLDQCFDKKAGFSLDNYNIVSKEVAKETSIDVRFITQAEWVLDLLKDEPQYSSIIREFNHKRMIFYVQHRAAEKNDTIIKCLESQLDSEPNALLWMTKLYLDQNDFSKALEYVKNILANSSIEKEAVKPYLLSPLVRILYELEIKPNSENRSGNNLSALLEDNLDAYKMMAVLCEKNFAELNRFYSIVLTELETNQQVIERIESKSAGGSNINPIEEMILAHKNKAYQIKSDKLLRTPGQNIEPIIWCLEKIPDEPNALLWLTLLHFNKKDWGNTLLYVQKCLNNPQLSKDDAIKPYLLPPLIKSMYELNINSKPDSRPLDSFLDTFGEDSHVYDQLAALCKDDNELQKLYTKVLDEFDKKRNQTSKLGQLETKLRGQREAVYRRLARKLCALFSDRDDNVWYTNILKDSPDDAEANLFLARFDIKSNQLYNAGAKYKMVLSNTKSLQLPPEFDLEANLFLARMTAAEEDMGGHNFVAASKYYLQVLKLQPDNCEASLFLGGLRLRESLNPEGAVIAKLDEAEKLYAAVLKKDAHNSNALRGMGRCYFYKKEWEKAYAHFSQALCSAEKSKAEAPITYDSFFSGNDFAAMLFSRYKHLCKDGNFSEHYEKDDSIKKDLTRAVELISANVSKHRVSGGHVSEHQVSEHHVSEHQSDNPHLLFLEKVMVKLYLARKEQTAELRTDSGRIKYFGFDPLSDVESSNAPNDLYTLIKDEIEVIAKYGYDLNTKHFFSLNTLSRFFSRGRRDES